MSMLSETPSVRLDFGLPAGLLGSSKTHVQNKAIIHDLTPSLLPLAGAACAAVKALALTLFETLLYFQYLYTSCSLAYIWCTLAQNTCICVVFCKLGVLLPILGTQCSSFNVLFVDFCSLQAFPSTHSLPLRNVSSLHHFLTHVSGAALPPVAGRLSTSSAAHLCVRWATDRCASTGAAAGRRCLHAWGKGCGSRETGSGWRCILGQEEQRHGGESDGRRGWMVTRVVRDQAQLGDGRAGRSGTCAGFEEGACSRRACSQASGSAPFLSPAWAGWSASKAASWSLIACFSVQFFSIRFLFLAKVSLLPWTTPNS